MTENFEDYLGTDEAVEAPKPTIVALALEMKELKAELEAAEERLKPLQRRYDEVRKRLLPDALAEAGVKNLKLADGGQVYMSTKVQASVKEEHRQQFFHWLRDNGHGSLITPHVHPATLTAWVKEQREQRAPVPDVVSVWEEPLAVLRK